MSLFANTSIFNSKPSDQLKNPNTKDVPIPSPPEDTVSGLEFSSNGSFLASSSWDGKVRVWEIGDSGINPKIEQTMTCPCMDLCWSNDGSRIYMAQMDGIVKLWDLSSNTVTDHGKHQDTARTVHYISGGNYECVMTGSWDKSIKFWDSRQQKEMMSVNCNEKVYGVDCTYPMAVAILANRGCIVYNLENTPTEYQRVKNINLKHMFRCVKIFNDRTRATPTPRGYAIGSIEGRVAINYITEDVPTKNFTFKCHRRENTPQQIQEVYPVHDVGYNPQTGTIATTGGDGNYSFWDIDARTKLKSSEIINQSITKCAISPDGEIFAYAVAYDWAKGYDQNDNNSKKPCIYLSRCLEDMKSKDKGKTNVFRK